MLRPLTLALALALPVGGTVHAGSSGALSCQEDVAILVSESGEIPVRVEIADDADERARGLMHRTSLPPGQGMLFIYSSPQQVAFWMKNTLIPLDLLFIDAAGRVRHIHPNARPHDLTSIPGATEDDPSPERLMVLEIGGGEAARLGLTTGSILRHPRLPQHIAAAPCP
ncbi:DUF192 domain-containing protein [uncultured Paracoccus sp.]|uniref:DUF192 domain-containing protein n=1 Tax=uncultured Paracoccus sp. TaxID=189685 RepID=UPI002620CEC0|nr:DUF192 domain-containing protein [uncultured Paracoccus sp.]